MEELQKLKRTNKILKIFITLIIIYLIIIIISGLYIDLSPSTASDYESSMTPFYFNDKFESCEGESKKGTVVKSLLSTVMINNTNYIDDETKQISIIVEDENSNSSELFYTSEEITQLKNTINSARRYDISMIYNEDGYVSKIKIVKKSNDINNTTNENNTNNSTNIYVQNIEN